MVSDNDYEFMMPSTSKSDRLQKRKKLSDSNMEGQVDNISKMISAEQGASSIDNAIDFKVKSTKSKKSKFVPKPKRVKRPKVNWLDLPSDVMANILSRIGVFDILENAQKCGLIGNGRSVLRKICMQLVDRSQGQMVDISIKYFCNKGILRYIADRSSQLRRLEITSCSWDLKGAWGDSSKKLSLLEELSLCVTYISGKDIEAAGRFCPLLKTLKVNQRPRDKPDDELAVAIGKNLPEFIKGTLS
uniref:putative F-box/LRR-repeat protein 9 n=1 Tax=Erigeron canadensis TaxID=72917 RepID=UPI001CB97300|nr:putative F-box/LRR-repeat protein 9 [Erigeron canadensis]